MCRRIPVSATPAPGCTPCDSSVPCSGSSCGVSRVKSGLAAPLTFPPMICSAFCVPRIAFRPMCSAELSSPMTRYPYLPVEPVWHRFATGVFTGFKPVPHLRISLFQRLVTPRPR